MKQYYKRMCSNIESDIEWFIVDINDDFILFTGAALKRRESVVRAERILSP